MANANEVKGVTAQRKEVLVYPKKDNPKRQFMTYAEAVADSQRLKRADAAAEAARLRVLNETESGEETAEGSIQNPSEAQKKFEKAKETLAKAKKKLDENPDSKAYQKKFKEAEEALEVAESELD